MGSFVLGMSLVVLWFAFWCFYFFIRKFCRGSHQTEHDIELGFPRSQSMQEPSDDQQDHHKAFKEISWAVYKENTKEEITNNKTECVICIQEFKDEDECKVRLQCNHIYHKTCIDRWLAVATHRHCPYCRGSVRVDGPMIADDDKNLV